MMKILRPIIASNEVPYLQMTSVGSHSTSGREKEGKKGRTGKGMTNFMRWRKMEDDMTEDRHLWRLGVGGQPLSVYIIIIIIIITIIIMIIMIYVNMLHLK